MLYNIVYSVLVWGHDQVSVTHQVLANQFYKLIVQKNDKVAISEVAHLLNLKSQLPFQNDITLESIGRFLYFQVVSYGNKWRWY